MFVLHAQKRFIFLQLPNELMSKQIRDTQVHAKKNVVQHL